MFCFLCSKISNSVYWGKKHARKKIKLALYNHLKNMNILAHQNLHTKTQVQVIWFLVQTGITNPSQLVRLTKLFRLMHVKFLITNVVGLVVTV